MTASVPAHCADRIGESFQWRIPVVLLAQELVSSNSRWSRPDIHSPDAGRLLRPSAIGRDQAKQIAAFISRDRKISSGRKKVKTWLVQRISRSQCARRTVGKPFDPERRVLNVSERTRPRNPRSIPAIAPRLRRPSQAGKFSEHGCIGDEGQGLGVTCEKRTGFPTCGW